MTNKERISSNNALIDEAIAKANELPNAGSSENLTEELEQQAQLITQLEEAVASKGAATSVLESLTVTENGTYIPEEGVDGFDEVVVNVAGSGESGEEIKTCSVTISRKTISISSVGLTTYTSESGVTPLFYQSISQPTIFPDVICGSIVAIYTGRPVISGYEVTGGAQLINYRDVVWYFSIPQNPTGDISITVRDDD